MGHHRDERLQRKLERLHAALGQPAPIERQRRKRSRGGTVLIVGLCFLAAAITSGHLGLLMPAVILLIIAAGQALRGTNVESSLPAGVGQHDPSRAHVGMGATVAGDAVIEPGAIVEMGATVASGATIRSGAVVRMGATVGKGAVVESGAVVGWGATVKSGARVGADAVVGAGSTVAKDAVVGAGERLLPGTSFTAASSPAAPAPPRAADPREARIAAACARIETELAQASPAIREHLGDSAKVATSLRATCDDLMKRERALRAESSPEALAFLEQEQSELEKRAAAATDEHVRASLQSAVAAIADQLRQRGMLKAGADRIDAELTRLSWTLDGMATQLVRLRTAGDAAAVPPEAMSETVRQLHDEIDAISEALEQTALPERVALAPPREADAPILPQRDRVR